MIGNRTPKVQRNKQKNSEMTLQKDILTKCPSALHTQVIAFSLQGKALFEKATSPTALKESKNSVRLGRQKI